MGPEYFDPARNYQISVILLTAGPPLVGLALGDLVYACLTGRHWLAGPLIGLVSGVLGVLLGVGSFFIVAATPNISWPPAFFLMTIWLTIGALSPLVWVPLFLRWGRDRP